MIATSANSHSRYSRFSKRFLDVVASCIGLASLAPLFVLLPVLIKLESDGPVIYKRGVIGKDDIPFSAYKFRTMVDDAETILENDPELAECFLECFKLKKDPRITKVGYFLRKYSLDEIPQLINVLRGQMSLIGPRMMTNLELERYGEHRDLVLSVKPGLSGLWQVSGRQDVSFERRVKLDVDYVVNWSLWKDITILYKTFRVVLNGEGAY